MVFADQTLASVLEATRVRSAVGPNVPWFDERLRWDALLNVSPDGSVARRFGVFVMLLCLVVCVMLILPQGPHPRDRDRTRPGASSASSSRPCSS